MSQRINISIECPNCQHHYTQEFFRTLWGENPVLRKMVMEDRVNIAKCPHCGHSFHLPLAMLFVDVEKKFAVWWEPNYDAQIDQLTAGFSKMLGPGNYYETAPRIKDWNDFKDTVNKYYAGELTGQSKEAQQRQEKMAEGVLKSLVADLEKKKKKKQSGCLGSILLLSICAFVTTGIIISLL